MAAGGRIALDAARKDFPELVLVDLEMPELNGWQLLRVLRQDFRTSEIPALAMTADDAISLERAVSAGFCGLLRKPFTRADLLQAIGRSAERPEEPPDQTRTKASAGARRAT